MPRQFPEVSFITNLIILCIIFQIIINYDVIGFIWITQNNYFY